MRYGKFKIRDTLEDFNHIKYLFGIKIIKCNYFRIVRSILEYSPNQRYF